jgi:Ca2+-binding RTX toxin-like protein
LRGLAGNDNLFGGAGDDIYEFEPTNNLDVINDAPFVTEEIISAAGVLNSTLYTATWTYLGTVNSGANLGYRLVVTRNGTGEEVYRSRDGVDFIYALRTSTTRPIPAPSSWPSANGREAPARPVLAGRAARNRLRIITIAASTGGPAALRQVLTALPADLPVPVLIVQHIARGFVVGLVEWLRLHCALRVTIAQDGVVAAPGTVYVAPDDRHLGVGANGRLRVTAEPAIDGFRPSGTYLFRTAAEICRSMRSCARWRQTAVAGLSAWFFREPHPMAPWGWRPFARRVASRSRKSSAQQSTRECRRAPLPRE